MSYKNFSELTYKQQLHIVRRQLEIEDNNEQEAEEGASATFFPSQVEPIYCIQEHSVEFSNSGAEGHEIGGISDEQNGHHYSFSSDESSEYEQSFSDSNSEPEEFVQELANFCITYLSDAGTNKLLSILQSVKEGIPKSALELYGKQASEMPKPVAISGGDFLYLGISENLKWLDASLVKGNTIEIDISWDGVRLNKSSSTKMWPIVMSLPNLPSLDPMLVGLFVGSTDPKNPNEFFYSLIKELNDIYDNGKTVEVGKKKKKMKLKVRLFVSDTPARSFALCK